MDDEIEDDPAMAEMMGFSGFGSQLGKKRKFNTADLSFVEGQDEPSKSNVTVVRTAANNMPLGNRDASRTVQAPKSANTQVSIAQMAAPPENESDVAITQQQSQPSAEALRNGIKNERGDVAYFLPSFVEDPWKDLRR